MGPHDKTQIELDELGRLVRTLDERIETLMLGMRYRREDSRDAFATMLRRTREYLKLAIAALGARSLEKTQLYEASWVRERVARLTGNLASGVFSNETPSTPPAGDSPHAQESPGFHGDTGSIALADLLHMLQMQAQCGTLTVSLPTEDICLEFDRGELIHAYSRSTPSGQRLGEILIRRGIIGAKQLENALRGAGDQKARLGDALRTLGLVKEAELRAALDEQIHGLFHRLLAAPRASYVFREGTAGQTADRARLNLMQLLLESTKKLDESSAPAV